MMSNYPIGGKDEAVRGFLDVHPEMNEIEKEIILTIIEDALHFGYDVTVYDGGETVVERGKSKEDIFSAMFSTGSDTLIFNQGESQVGWIFLVYGNRECVVSDYSDNPAMNDLLKNADALTEKYS
jgi:hypothetical protein